MGKTVCRVLCQETAFGAHYLLTTRSPRKGERDGVDYHFVDEKFHELKERELWNGRRCMEILCDRPKRWRLRQKIMMLLEIDVQGAAQIHNNSVEGFIFCRPAWRTLRRIMGRGSDTPEAMKNS